MTHNKLSGGQVGVVTSQMRKKLNHNIPNICTLAASQTYTSTNTQTLVPGFVTDTLESGNKYQFEMELYTTMTTNGGLALAFNTPDTLTLTSIVYATEELTASATATAVGTTATMGTKVIDNATAAYTIVRVSGSFVVNATGTLEITAAQHTSHTDTTTIAKGSTLRMWCDTTDTD